MDYTISEDLNVEEARAIRRDLDEYVERIIGPRHFTEFAIGLRASNGSAVGGITGITIWDWLQINTLWVPEEIRGQGYGGRLLESAEELGRQRGCRFARLSTWEFEAKEFYEHRGYRAFSSQEDFPAGHTQFYLAKTL